MLRKILLACGIVASIDYVAADVLAAVFYPEYHSFRSRVVSELMATNAPTERLVDPFFLLYDALMIAFAIGVWMSTRKRILTGALVLYAAIGVLGPTVGEMNMRGSGGDPRNDIVHIALTIVISILIFTAVFAAARSFGRGFRVYSYATAALMFGFGILTMIATPTNDTDQSAWFGLFERVDIWAFLVWIVVLASQLLKVDTVPRT